MIPLFDVVGSVNSVPSHVSSTWVNSGIVLGIITMVISAVEAHCPSSGLNVYVVVLNASKTGDQVPIIPLFETTWSGDPPGHTSLPSQTSSI